ncbi:hypothetical protein EYZ11_000116 [Aspergillus tanneri]|uniref:Uncharacterized protein n=1 Tax=Aspergillus tanneri TaxID=1220188 RepID=A0A4S3JXW8_9EURO|nr:hypothetical protein EYZ11_000116 [Aspergillus tanneri]
MPQFHIIITGCMTPQKVQEIADLSSLPEVKWTTTTYFGLEFEIHDITKVMKEPCTTLYTVLHDLHLPQIQLLSATHPPGVIH